MKIKKIKKNQLTNPVFHFDFTSLYFKTHRRHQEWRSAQRGVSMMGYFIELLTDVHEWKLSALVATEDNHKFVKKTIPSIETNITASDKCFMIMS